MAKNTNSEKILLIDSDRKFQDFFRNLFNEYDVLTYSDYSSCVAAAKAYKPGVIMMDLNIKPAGGFDICEDIKKDGQLRKVPLIILSARSKQSDKIKALESGADDYIQKPFSRGELKARINAVKRSYN